MVMDPTRPSTMEASPYSPVLDFIEQQPWLDTADGAISRALDPLLKAPEAQPVKDLLHGRWLGHALHPVLTDLPIGFWTGSLLLDLTGARWSAGVINMFGSLAAVATAITGVADWTDTFGRERKLGLAHGLLNLTGMGFQLMSLSARLRMDHGRAFQLSFLGWSTSVAAAWLGGELVYNRGVMVNRDAWTAGPAAWTPVLKESELADRQTRKVEVEGRAVLLYREGLRVFAIENTCAHAGGPLDEGEVHDGIVTCPWHGSQYRLTDGAALRGPTTFPQPRLLSRVSKGMIEVRGRA
jgi:nitrite reductase/ring-hydroxylating ferredoxin subunit/uncharacterized membrane protein